MTTRVTVLAEEKGALWGAGQRNCGILLQLIHPKKNCSKCSISVPYFFPHATLAGRSPIGLSAASHGFCRFSEWLMEGGWFNDGHYAGLEQGCCVYLLAPAPNRLLCLW